MNPPPYHQNPVDLHWFHYFEDNPPLLGDDTMELHCDLSEKALEVVVPPLELAKDHISDELPVDDLSFWRLWDDDLPLLSCNDVIISDGKPIGDGCQVTSGEANYGGTAAAADHGGRKVGRRSKALELEEIEKHFEMPIAKAAKELKVGLTVLKKRCRELKIKRWPHRKLKSLGSLIQNVEELGLKEEMEMLKEHKRMMEKLPEMELTQRTKKLRQACFKFNYKKKRLNSHPNYPFSFHYP